MAEETEETDKLAFLAFSRIYSGTLCRGQKLYVLQPRYDPREVNLDDKLTLHDLKKPAEEVEMAAQDGLSHVSEATVSGLYILMGREVVEVESVPAGNVVGIAGLEQHILKSATVTTTLACPAFQAMNFVAAPILRVAIEPVHAWDMPALTQGMRLLNQADASVEVSIQSTGEHILSTAGEVHLQRCLDDLRDTFAKVELKASTPITPFRETIIPPPKVDTLNEMISEENVVRFQTNPLLQENEEGTPSNELVSIQTSNKACTLLIQAKPLPQTVTDLLCQSSHLLKLLHLISNTVSSKFDVHLNDETVERLHKLHSQLREAFSSSPEWQNFPQVVDNIWAFGPRAVGTNVLLNDFPEYKRPSIWHALDSKEEGRKLKEYDNSIVSGFQLATLSGPLCEEPMQGVCFILKGWNYTRQDGGRKVGSVPTKNESDREESNSNQVSSSYIAQAADQYGPFSGQLISAIKEGCRRAFLSQPTRLMAAMYTCDILATADVLGKLYAVLGRRNGRVCAEEMREGTAMFSIKALVPVAESFGFAEEVRKKTSGLASPQLVFSHWEVRHVEVCIYTCIYTCIYIVYRQA